MATTFIHMNRDFCKNKGANGKFMPYPFTSTLPKVTEIDSHTSKLTKLRYSNQIHFWYWV